MPDKKQKPKSEGKKEEKKEGKKKEETPNPNVKSPEFTKLTEGVISKDENNLSDLLKKILEK